MNSVLELDGFFVDLLPSAAAISVISDPSEFTDCMADENRTEVRFAADGVAKFIVEDLLTKEEIKNMVTFEKLEAYLGESICKELDVFDATVSDAGSDPQYGINGAWSHESCDSNYPALARDLESVALASIVVAVIVVLCIVGCFCACCKFIQITVRSKNEHSIIQEQKRQGVAAMTPTNLLA
jgi:hypothetical protein